MGVYVKCAPPGCRTYVLPVPSGLMYSGFPANAGGNGERDNRRQAFWSTASLPEH